MTDMGWEKSTRKKLKFEEKFHLKYGDIYNKNQEADVGEGSSCLVYHGRTDEKHDILSDTEVIVKEFYPKSEESLIAIERQQDGSLKISEEAQQKTAFKRSWIQFKQGFANQKKLSNSNAMEIAVKPLFDMQKWGDAYYIVSDVHLGEDLSKVHFDSLKKKLKMAIALTETFSILHECKYIMLDMKPENLMWVESTGTVRILDTDSLFAFGSDAADDNKKIFTNNHYMGPEFKVLQEHSGNPERYRSDKKHYLEPRVDIYSIGMYLFEEFFNKKTKWEYLEDDLEDSSLIEQFEELYEKEEIDRTTLGEIGEDILKIVKKMTESVFAYRMRDISEANKKLEQIYFLVASEHLVPRKQYAKANASFAAYNLLQKYPLFKYGLSEKDGQKEIDVALFGSHAMRREMLSALISIGQMLETKLNIYVVSEDVEQFWDSYPAAGESHDVFESAVLWEKQDGTASNTYDRQLVAEPLASIHLINGKKWEEDISGEKNSLTHILSAFCEEYPCSYFIFMCEDMEKNKELLKKLSVCKNETARNVFAAYLSEESDEGGSRGNKEARKNNKKVTESIGYKEGNRKAAESIGYKEDIESFENSEVKSFPISTSCFSEKYNENMFKTKIYQMGLMAHMYYSGYMVEDEKVEQKTQVESLEKQMAKLEKEFRQNVYNIASSERCALHGIYKMASLGISPDRPGKILKYFHQIEKEEVRNQLAYLEHLSWTAYMLTSGVLPVAVDTMDTYAYKGVSETEENNSLSEFNDWKEKKEGKVIRHPLLVSAGLKRGLPKTDWDSISEEEKASLDELDKVSYEIYLWYKKNKARFYQEFKDAVKKLNTVLETEIPESMDLNRTTMQELNTAFKNIPDLKQKKEMHILLKQLETAGENCIEKMCQEVFSQDEKKVNQCKDLIENIKHSAQEYTLSSGNSSERESVIKAIENVQQKLKPVFDSYKDRDFKLADENLVWASLDLLG